jgi:hypothetical protein
MLLVKLTVQDFSGDGIQFLKGSFRAAAISFNPSDARDSLTNTGKYCLITSLLLSVTRPKQPVLSSTIANDKGKPVARQGRKAMSLSNVVFYGVYGGDCLVAEGDLKKAAAP